MTATKHREGGAFDHALSLLARGCHTSLGGYGGVMTCIQIPCLTGQGEVQAKRNPSLLPFLPFVFLCSRPPPALANLFASCFLLLAPILHPSPQREPILRASDVSPVRLRKAS
eukprot:scaffold1259_cov239-Pinguiococcus_pyrenoidosus.AAC.4